MHNGDNRERIAVGRGEYMNNLRLIVCMLVVGVTVFGTGKVSSQDYPNRPIRIVTAPAGGGSDFTARLIAEGISGPLG